MHLTKVSCREVHNGQGREGGPGKPGTANMSQWIGKNMVEDGQARVHRCHVNRETIVA